MTAPMKPGQTVVLPTVVTKKKLGELLVEKKLVSEDVIKKALIMQEKRKKEGNLFLLGEILLELGAIKDEELYAAIRTIIPSISQFQEYGYISQAIKASIGSSAYLDLQKSQSNNKELHILDIIDKNIEYLRFKTQKRLIVSLMKPYVPQAIVGVPEKLTVKIVAGKQVFYYEEKQVHVDWHPKIIIPGTQVILSKQEYIFLTAKPDTDTKDGHESKETFKGEIPYSVHDIVSDACYQGASDLHIIPKQTDYYVYFRIQGQLSFQSKYTLDLERGRNLIFAFKNIGASSTFGQYLADDKRQIKDARMELTETCGGVDLRIVVIPTGNMRDEELVGRIIRKAGLEKKSLEEQGYFAEDAVIIEKAFWRQGGLFLTSGKTNSGKTTLNAQLLMTDNERKWETTEDPIEYAIPNKNVCQHQTFMPKDGPQVGFAELVKGYKRGDPDGVMVGEIRQDEALIRSTIEASHAGQLVMGTVHIGSAFEIYDAMAEVFNIPYFTSARLILYSHNQSLVKCLCNKCRVIDRDKVNYNALNNIKAELPYIIKDELEIFLENSFQTYTANPSGCSECDGTGYKGRTPIYEYVYPNVKFVKWLLDEHPDRYAIESRACSGNQKIGVNKLQIFMRKLKAGTIDAGHHTLRELM